MTNTFGIIVIVAVFIIEIIVNYCVLQETNVKHMSFITLSSNKFTKRKCIYVGI